MNGRRCKRTPWVQFLYDYVELEYERLCESVVKITAYVVVDFANYSLTSAESLVRPCYVGVRSGKECRKLLTYDVVYRYQK